jgi:hypothetical protein
MRLGQLRQALELDISRSEIYTFFSRKKKTYRGMRYVLNQKIDKDRKRHTSREYATYAFNQQSIIP